MLEIIPGGGVAVASGCGDGVGFPGPVNAGGTQALKLDDMLGESASGSATPTLCKDESFLVYAAGFNYPAFESAYPQNLSVAPRIAGSNGQADVTTSDALQATYP